MYFLAKIMMTRGFEPRLPRDGNVNTGGQTTRFYDIISNLSI